MYTDAKVSITLSYNENKPEELSGTGAVYACGMALGLWDDHVFDNIRYTEYDPGMVKSLRDRKYEGWLKAVSGVLTGE